MLQLGRGLDIADVGTRRLTWGRLARLVQQLMNDPASAVYRSIWPDHAAWTPTVQMIAEVINKLAIANWLQTEDGAKRFPKHRPKPLLPPWEQDKATPDKATEKFGTARMTLGEVDKWMGW